MANKNNNHFFALPKNNKNLDEYIKENLSDCVETDAPLIIGGGSITANGMTTWEIKNGKKITKKFGKNKK